MDVTLAGFALIVAFVIFVAVMLGLELGII